MKDTHAKIIQLDLSLWLRDNPLPAICEPKYDGQRVFLFKSNEHLVVSGRIGIIYTPASHPTVFSKVPELVHAPRRMILDGEYVSKDGLHFFDILQIDDRDLRPLPLYRRKEMLGQVIGGSGIETPFVWAESPQGIQKFVQDEKSREGIVVKNPVSFYGQPNSWLKLNRSNAVDCFVIDLEDGKEKKAWTVAVYDATGEIVVLGKVSSYTERVDPQKVRLGSVVEVRFAFVEDEFRAEFMMRLRRDKLAIECLISQIPQLMERNKRLVSSNE